MHDVQPMRTLGEVMYFRNYKIMSVWLAVCLGTSVTVRKIFCIKQVMTPLDNTASRKSLSYGAKPQSFLPENEN